MGIFKKNIFSLALVILLGLIGVKALFHPGFYTSHDGEHQVIRLYHFNEALKDGQFPPRWAGTADNGYGYPLFVFSYQSPWFIGVPILRLGLSLTDAIKGVFIVGYIASGIFMYLWLKEMLGIFPGLVGSALYLWAPYRFSNIFVRASLGEATAFIFIPLVFWGIWKCKDKNKAKLGVILTSLGLAGLILSHLMVLIVFALPLGFWILIQVGQSTGKIGVIKRIIVATLLGIGLSAYYLVPAILEKQYTMATQILQSHFSDHFVALKQLIYSKWGYGFDFPGTINDEMSFQVGIAQWLAIILLLIVNFVIWLRKRKINLLAIYVISLFVLSILMMISVSKPVWEQISKYSYFDFPWRFLSLAVFSGSLAAALIAQHLKERAWLLVIFFIFLTFYTNRNHLRVNQYVYNADNYYINNLQTTNQFDEYRPKTLNSDYIKVKRERFEYNEKTIKLANQTSKSNYFLLNGKAEDDEVIRINIAYYLGWKIWLNGGKQKDILSEDGSMQVKVPEGDFSIEGKFTNTFLRTITNIISFISVILVILWFVII